MVSPPGASARRHSASSPPSSPQSDNARVRQVRFKAQKLRLRRASNAAAATTSASSAIAAPIAAHSSVLKSILRKSTIGSTAAESTAAFASSIALTSLSLSLSISSSTAASTSATLLATASESSLSTVMAAAGSTAASTSLVAQASTSSAVATSVVTHSVSSVILLTVSASVTTSSSSSVASGPSPLVRAMLSTSTGSNSSTATTSLPMQPVYKSEFLQQHAGNYEYIAQHGQEEIVDVCKNILAWNSLRSEQQKELQRLEMTKENTEEARLTNAAKIAGIRNLLARLDAELKELKAVAKELNCAIKYAMLTPEQKKEHERKKQMNELEARMKMLSTRIT